MNKNIKVCPKHNEPLRYYAKDDVWFCHQCLFSSYLTQQAQDAAVKRYNHSEKHKTSEKKYEQGSGKEAREKYLKSDKYRQRRREYNERLAESLRIARAAHTGHAISEKAVERKKQEEFAELIADIREYIDEQGRQPTTKNVTHWAKENYSKTISLDQTKEIINRATLRR